MEGHPTRAEIVLTTVHDGTAYYIVRVEAGDGRVWGVATRYSQYVSLRRDLARQHGAGGVAGLVLPPKVYWGSAEPSLIARRQQRLNAWLGQCIAMFPQCRVLAMFLADNGTLSLELRAKIGLRPSSNVSAESRSGATAAESPNDSGSCPDAKWEGDSDVVLALREQLEKAMCDAQRHKAELQAERMVLSEVAAQAKMTPAALQALRQKVSTIAHPEGATNIFTDASASALPIAPAATQGGSNSADLSQIATNHGLTTTLLDLMDELRAIARDKDGLLMALKNGCNSLSAKLGKPVDARGAFQADESSRVDTYLKCMEDSAAGATASVLQMKAQELTERITVERAERDHALAFLESKVHRLRAVETGQVLETDAVRAKKEPFGSVLLQVTKGNLSSPGEDPSEPNVGHTQQESAVPLQHDGDTNNHVECGKTSGKFAGTKAIDADPIAPQIRNRDSAWAMSLRNGAARVKVYASALDRQVTVTKNQNHETVRVKKSSSAGFRVVTKGTSYSVTSSGGITTVH
eukprot:SAG31_NODE_3769_length_3901_cov_2.916360_1_plen_522_part_00